MEFKITEEMMEKAKNANNAQEIIAMAEECGIGLGEEQAQAYLEQLHKSGELSDDELDNVAGGACYDKYHHLMTTIGYSCSHFVCTQNGFGNNPPHTCFACDYWAAPKKSFAPCIGVTYPCKHPANMRS